MGANEAKWEIKSKPLITLKTSYLMMETWRLVREAKKRPSQRAISSVASTLRQPELLFDNVAGT